MMSMRSACRVTLTILLLTGARACLPQPALPGAAAADPDNAAAVAAAAPATQPAIPERFEDTADYAALKAGVDVARARLDAITAARTQIVEQAPLYQAARKRLDELEAALVEARKTGTLEQRMAASGAFVKAKTSLDSMRQSAIAIDPDYQAALAASRKADAALKEAREVFDRQRAERLKADAQARAKAAAAVALRDPVRHGLGEGRVSVGMTAAQVRSLYGNGHVVSATPTHQVVTFDVREPNHFYRMRVSFEDGKVEEWTSTSRQYPSVRFVNNGPRLVRGMSMEQIGAQLGAGRAIHEEVMVGDLRQIMSATRPAAGAAPRRMATVRAGGAGAAGATSVPQTFTMTSYAWQIITETRSGISHRNLVIRLADFQLYDYRLE